MNLFFGKKMFTLQLWVSQYLFEFNISNMDSSKMTQISSKGMALALRMSRMFFRVRSADCNDSWTCSLQCGLGKVFIENLSAMFFKPPFQRINSL
jgi:hypothetical protein